MACYDPNVTTPKIDVALDESQIRKGQLKNSSGTLSSDGGKAAGISSRTRLEFTIETEILPRLILAHKDRLNRQALEISKDNGGVPAIEGFVNLIIGNDFGPSVSYVEALIESGSCLDAIYLDLLAPTARRLGELWQEDLCCFTEVALGSSRLHQILSGLSPSFLSEGETHGHKHRAVMSTLPGDRHTFGLVMAVDFFRRAGWDVIGWPLETGDRVEELVRCEMFDMVGFSISHVAQLDAAKTIIKSVRRASLNRTIVVMVGGSVFHNHPEFVRQVGADASAEHGPQAVERAENLVTQLVRQ
jgi:methanogenic corrinoid protein MtbC1